MFTIDMLDRNRGRWACFRLSIDRDDDDDDNVYGATAAVFIGHCEVLIVVNTFLELFSFVVMVIMTSCGEMSFADFHLAVKWLCDISRQHGDQWLLNHADCAVSSLF